MTLNPFNTNGTGLIQEQMDHMKRYIDPRTETISYSGADFKAIILLPIDQEGFQTELDKLNQEITYLNNELHYCLSSNNTNSAIISDLQTDMDYAWAQYELAVIENDIPQIAFWNNEYILARSALSVQLQKQSLTGGDPGRIFLLNSELKTLQEQKKLMEKTKSEGSAWVKPIKLGDLQTITISSFREKFPVRTCGRVYAKSYTRGARTIAGSMIFTVFNKHALWELCQAHLKFYNTGVLGSDESFPNYSTVLVDQLPPFDITLIASNEVGDSSYSALFGVELVSEGITISIQDLITENVMQYVARDYDPLRPLTNKRQVLEMGQLAITAEATAKQDSTERARRGIRLNPFI